MLPRALVTLGVSLSDRRLLAQLGSPLTTGLLASQYGVEVLHA